MKKRIISLALICVLLITVFAGCASSGGKDKTTDPSSNSSDENQSNPTSESNDPSVTEPTNPTTPEDLTATQPHSGSGQTTTTTAPEGSSFPADLNGKKLIAITFDDGPSKYTRDLITELNNRGAKGTFFMVGSRVGEYPDTVKFMKESGHELGSHTFNHANIKKSADDKVRAELSQTDEALINACGQEATSFRPPEGAYSAEKLALIDKPCIMWSVDPLDWKYRDAQSVYDKIMASAGDGSIVLLHDLYPTSIAGGLRAIDDLMAQGYVFVTVTQLLQRNDAKVVNQTPYFSEKPAAV